MPQQVWTCVALPVLLLETFEQVAPKASPDAIEPSEVRTDAAGFRSVKMAAKEPSFWHKT
jgi:hypothetical protein